MDFAVRVYCDGCTDIFRSPKQTAVVVESKKPSRKRTVVNSTLQDRSSRRRQGRARAKSPRGRRLDERAALDELDTTRAELLRELDQLVKNPDYLLGQPGHLCCTRKLNQMRITPLEARAIRLAFDNDPQLRRKLPQVLARLRAELQHLKDNSQRQNFDCPLLDGTLCLVHTSAKPIGCLAWHPAADESESGAAHYTTLGWQAFDDRDDLNDQVHGPEWKLRAIPLWLRRVFAVELAAGDDAAIDVREVHSQRPKKRRD
jgi:hypothetical protein